VHDDCCVSRSIFASGSLSVAGVSEGETPPGTTSEPGTTALSASARKVQETLQALGLSGAVLEFAGTTRTSADAAKRIGCEVGQIAKSLVFRAQTSGRPVLVIASGANRVNEWRVGVLLKEVLEKAGAALVREATGFAIGGVPPVGHPQPLPTYIDQDLMQYADIWAAAGTPNAVFRLAPADLVRITGGVVVKVT
jgi:prolyl-tRNA editing enzyme YbaK/EbsC (Cys-tRNA(Pro) deacylase)